MPIYTTPDLNRPKILEEYPATFMDMVGTSFNYAVSENITAMASRQVKRYVSNRVVDVMDRSGKFSQSELFYTPEQANEIGKDYGMEPIKKSISKFEFEINLEQAKRQRVRESRMAAYRGPGTTLTRVATGFLASFVDPLELLTSLIPVVPLLRKGKIALGLAEGAAEARTMGRAMEGAIEGAFGATVTEPARYMFANDEQMDYDLTDSLMNVAFGAGLGSALHVGIAKLADFAEKSAKRAEAIRAGEQFATVEDEIARLNKANEMASVPERIAAASPETHPNALRAHMAELDSGHRSIAADEVIDLDARARKPYRADIPQDNDARINQVIDEVVDASFLYPEDVSTASADEMNAVRKIDSAIIEMRNMGVDEDQFMGELFRRIDERFDDSMDSEIFIEELGKRILNARKSNPSRQVKINGVSARMLTNDAKVNHADVEAAASRIAQAERSHPASLTSDPAASTAVSESLSNTSEQVDFENPESLNADTQSAQRVMEDATARALVDNPDLADALGIVVEGGEDGAKPKLRFPEIENADAELANTQKNVRQALSDVANCLIGF